MIWINPAIITLQDKKVKKFSVEYAAIMRAVINDILTMIGRAADKANLLYEFRIDERIDEILIKIRKGNIILATLTSSLNLSLSFIKPGANSFIKKGI